jgi:hypothetical protein
MKELKQRFSRWYNHQTSRFGTLWAERFTSVLVEDESPALRIVAAYIDLNPVRAGLVTNPQDYRYSGYSAAVAGNAHLQAGLMHFMRSGQWANASSVYLNLLLVTAGSAGSSGKVVLDRETIRAELKRGAKLDLGQVLRLRLRHMSAGVMLGSREFVNHQFEVFRDRFGPKRKDGARPLRGVPLPNLRALRHLRLDVFG